MSVKGFLNERHERIRQEFYSNVRPWIAVGVAACKALSRRLTSTEYKSLIDLWGGANSYERRVLVPLLDDEAMADLAAYYIGQGGGKLGELSIAKSYNDAVEREFAPLLVERLREAAKAVAKAQEEDTRAGEAFDERIAEVEKWHAKWKHAEQDRDAARSEAEAWRKRAAEWEKKQHFAQKQAAIWEIEAQDLRDRLVQAEAALTHNTIACVK